MTTYLILLGVLAALQVVDVITTNRVIALGGAEANPIIAKFMEWFGDQWWLGKMAIAVPFLFLFWYAGEQDATIYGVGLLTGVFGFVGFSNWLTAKQMAAKRKGRK